MKRIQKILSATLCSLIAIGTTLCALGNVKLTSKAQDGEQIFTAEEYTASDNLLLENGELSLETIKMFSDKVKSSAENTDCSEITQVIPRQYLESTDEDAVFKYNGKEYGFYMVKEE